MLSNSIFRRILPSSRLASLKHKTTSALDIEKLEAEDPTDIDVIDEEAKVREAKLQKSRNKSRLSKADYNRLHGKPAFEEPMHWSHGTLKYNQKLYGTYGEASGFNPAYCWPTKEELQRRIDYERVAHPYTIQEMMDRVKVDREEKDRKLHERQADIVAKLAKLEGWKRDLTARIEKKENEAMDAKSRKDRLVEEVRRHFGYTVDPNSDKFKEMLEKKEKEQKKVMKEARRKAKEEKLLSKLTEGYRDDSKIQVKEEKKQDST